MFTYARFILFNESRLKGFLEFQSKDTSNSATSWTFLPNSVMRSGPLFVPVIPHLSLFVLEHFIDAGVEGRTREHGGDGIGQVQDSFKHRVHCLFNNKIQRNQAYHIYLVSRHFFTLHSPSNKLKEVELNTPR